MNEPARQINGDLLRQRREAKGWAPTDLATRACLSLRQVRQIEEGGNSSFYSESVKATAARKIAALLGLPQELAFVQAPSLSTGDIPAMADQVPADTAPTSAPGGTPLSHPPSPVGADLSSVMTHVAVATADIDPPPPQSLTTDGADNESRSSSFLWIALLAVAVGAGVLLMPKSPDLPQAPSSSAPLDPNPPAPPPMVLPADAAQSSGDQTSVIPTTPGVSPAPTVPPAVSAPGPAGAVVPAPNVVTPAPMNGAPKTP